MRTSIFFLLLIISHLSFSQNIKYFGKMNNSILSKLTAKEMLLYSECVSVFGMDGEHIPWIGDEELSKLKKDNSFFKGHVAIADSRTNKVVVRPVLGKNYIPKENFVFYIRRKGKNFLIKLYNLY